MLSFFSFLLVLAGSINWLTIGLLQFDFVAGLFGSQSSIFSRIIYVIIGVASLIIAYELIKNKGNFKISFKKKIKQIKAQAVAEHSDDNAKLNTQDFNNKNQPNFQQQNIRQNTEFSQDNSHTHSDVQNSHNSAQNQHLERLNQYKQNLDNK